MESQQPGWQDNLKRDDFLVEAKVIFTETIAIDLAYNNFFHFEIYISLCLS